MPLSLLNHESAASEHHPHRSFLAPSAPIQQLNHLQQQQPQQIRSRTPPPFGRTMSAGSSSCLATTTRASPSRAHSYGHSPLPSTSATTKRQSSPYHHWHAQSSHVNSSATSVPSFPSLHDTTLSFTTGRPKRHVPPPRNVNSLRTSTPTPTATMMMMSSLCMATPPPPPAFLLDNTYTTRPHEEEEDFVDKDDAASSCFDTTLIPMETSVIEEDELDFPELEDHHEQEQRPDVINPVSRILLHSASHPDDPLWLHHSKDQDRSMSQSSEGGESSVVSTGSVSSVTSATTARTRRTPPVVIGTVLPPPAIHYRPRAQRPVLM